MITTSLSCRRCIIFLALFYVVHTISILDIVVGAVVHHAHVHKFEKEINFGIVAPRQQDVSGQLEIPRYHPVSHCRL